MHQNQIEIRISRYFLGDSLLCDTLGLQPVSLDVWFLSMRSRPLPMVSQPEMPHLATVMRWLQSAEEWGVAFRDQYARARAQQAELNAERLIEVAENAEETSAGVQKARLLSDNIKWAASKLLPKKYGDRVDVKIDATSLPPPQVVVQIVNAPRRLPRGLSISGCKPKSLPSPAIVGAATLWFPSRPVKTRPMVPFPLRRGPTSKKIFCRRVSPPRMYPKIS